MQKREKLLITVIIIMGVIIIAAVTFLFIDGKKLTEENSVPVYFVQTSDKKAFELVPVRRKISSDKKRICTALKELLKGPTEKEKNRGLFTEIPSETKLLEINETKERTEINLSENFASGGGSTTMRIRLEQLIKTTLSSAGKPVYLKIEGKEVVGIGGEGIAVPQPLSEDMPKLREN